MNEGEVREIKSISKSEKRSKKIYIKVPFHGPHPKLGLEKL